MQKLARRTALTERLAAAKHRRQSERLTAAKFRVATRREQERQRMRNSLVKNERQARREDWVQGHLAPKRDVGKESGSYGAVDLSLTQGMEKRKDKIKGWGIAVGDRVAIVEEGHRDEGKIGRVEEVREKQEMVLVEEMNKADVAVPPYLLMSDPDPRRYRTISLPLPLSAVRLVAPLPHPQTGALRDVIISALRLRRRTIAQLRGTDPPERIIAGVLPAISIPYPEEKKIEEKDNDCDTRRIEVEDVTFTPTLTEPPMPGGVIDELRGRYSRFRTRHDEGWLEAKREEDRKEKIKQEWERLAMKSPVQEAATKRKMAVSRMMGEIRRQEKPDVRKAIAEEMEKNLGAEEVQRRIAALRLAQKEGRVYEPERESVRA